MCDGHCYDMTVIVEERPLHFLSWKKRKVTPSYNLSDQNTVKSNIYNCDIVYNIVYIHTGGLWNLFVHSESVMTGGGMEISDGAGMKAELSLYYKCC